VTDFLDSAVVTVKITPSGSEVKTGSGVDAAVVYINLRVAIAAEGDFAYSNLSSVTQGAVAPPSPSDPPTEEPTDPTVPDSPTYNGPDDSDHGNFIGEGLLRARFVANPHAAFNRFESQNQTNRFTGVLRQ